MPNTYSPRPFPAQLAMERNGSAMAYSSSYLVNACVCVRVPFRLSHKFHIKHSKTNNNAMEPEHVLWGCERFFEELASFSRDINRQVGTANESYCEYAVERLETCTAQWKERSLPCTSVLASLSVYFIFQDAGVACTLCSFFGIFHL